MALAAVGEADEEAKSGGNGEHDQRALLDLVGDFLHGIAAHARGLVAKCLPRIHSAFAYSLHDAGKRVADEIAHVTTGTRYLAPRDAGKTVKTLFQVAEQILYGGNFFGIGWFGGSRCHWLPLNVRELRRNSARQREPPPIVPSRGLSRAGIPSRGWLQPYDRYRVNPLYWRYCPEPRRSQWRLFCLAVRWNCSLQHQLSLPPDCISIRVIEDWKTKKARRNGVHDAGCRRRFCKAATRTPAIGSPSQGAGP